MHFDIRAILAWFFWLFVASVIFLILTRNHNE